MPSACASLRVPMPGFLALAAAVLVLPGTALLLVFGPGLVWQFGEAWPVWRDLDGLHVVAVASGLALTSAGLGFARLAFERRAVRLGVNARANARTLAVALVGAAVFMSVALKGLCDWGCGGAALALSVTGVALVGALGGVLFVVPGRTREARR